MDDGESLVPLDLGEPSAGLVGQWPAHPPHRVDLLGGVGDHVVVQGAATRASSVCTSTRKPSGPHQDSKPSLVVHRSHSSSTRARYVRSTTTFGLVSPVVA